MKGLNIQAVECNNLIANSNKNVLDMLSQRGKAIFFPKKGIIAQAADAKGKEINATIGIALEEDGTPLRLRCIEERIQLDPASVFPYASSYGLPSLRSKWLEAIREKNSSLRNIPISVPVVTSALTHGLSLCGYLFLNEGDTLYLPDLYWGNYRLIFVTTYGVHLGTYNTFKGQHLDLQALREKLLSGPIGKRVVLLNFPNNPTGYTPTFSEAKAIQDILIEVADAGNNVVALIDDAYFGLVYEDGIIKESLFAGLADAHERILAVKIDGATKEDYVWGFRVGYITYGMKGGNVSLYGALEAKTAGAVRGTVSNTPHISQSLLNYGYQSPDYQTQKKEKYVILKTRYDKVQEILKDHPEYLKMFSPLPFNSGYFMCVKPVKGNPEKLRKILLQDYSTGVIAVGDLIRIAFSSIPCNKLEQLFSNLYQATCQLSN